MNPPVVSVCTGSHIVDVACEELSDMYLTCPYQLLERFLKLWSGDNTFW